MVDTPCRSASQPTTESQVNEAPAISAPFAAPPWPRGPVAAQHLLADQLAAQHAEVVPASCNGPWTRGLWSRSASGEGVSAGPAEVWSAVQRGGAPAPRTIAPRRARP